MDNWPSFRPETQRTFSVMFAVLAIVCLAGIVVLCFVGGLLLVAVMN